MDELHVRLNILRLTKKVKIIPPEYSKENYLATFTPQTQLTPQQIFWSDDILKEKAKALKEHAKNSQPITTVTVYPTNTPAQRVPGVLPTKSQVKINIFALIQLFLKFDKTCKKRITPTGLTEREQGFEQTNECYLTEVIPFFKTLKEHFEGIQKSLIKEVKEMKEIFEELEAKVDQNVMDRKCDEIERKNLLIANENLIVDCLSKEVFYNATNSELMYQHLKETLGNNKSRLNQDAPAFDSVFEINKMKSSLQGKDNTIKKLKVQISQLMETRSEADRTLDFRALDFQIIQLTDKITRAKTIEKTTALLAENENLKTRIRGKMKCVTMDPVKPKVLAPEEARVERPLDSSLASVCLYTKQSQELLEYVIGSCPKDFNKKDKKIATTPLNGKKQVTFKETCETSTTNTPKHVEPQKVQKTNLLVIPSTGVTSSIEASGSKPRSKTKNSRNLPAKSDIKKKVEDHPRNNKSNLKRKSRVDSSISYKRTIINSNSTSACKTCNKCLISANHDKYVVKYLKSVRAPSVKNVMSTIRQVWKATGILFTNVGYQWKPTEKKVTFIGKLCLLLGITLSKVVPIQQHANVSTSKTVITKRLSCSKHMTGNRSRLRNFVKKFIGTVRYDNDHFGAIMGYGDYVIGDSVISRVYYAKGLGHNLFSVGQFCDSDLEVGFRKH
ncbi:hypothetical protein Tco_0768765 [Tanacetum coccineum]